MALSAARLASRGVRKEVRFSAQWVMNDRDRLGLSAKNYGLLVGVSALTIYNWE